MKIKIKTFLTTSASLLALATMSGTSNAQDQIAPAGITATAGSMHSAPFVASNLLDDETVEGFTNIGDPGPPERLANHQNNHWISADGVFTETITFDLGGTYDLVKLEVLNTSNTNWNDSETDTFTIATSTDGGTTYSAPSAPVVLQDYTLEFQTVPVVAAGSTHVQLITTNDPSLGTNIGTDDVRVGLNEVRFFHQLNGDSEPDGLLDTWEIDNFGNLSRNGTEDEEPDGLTNKQEHDLRTDPNDADSEGDGLDDGDEVNIYGTDPLDPDSDMDSLTDGAEVNIHNSDPTLTDTDGDLLDDGDEVNIHGTRPDLADTDGDGIDDYEEINVTMTDPLVPNEDPRGTEIDPATIAVTAGSRFNDTGNFDESNLLDGLTDEGNRDAHRGTHWIASEGTFTESVTFDLGGSYSLVSLEILNTSNTNWNDSETDRLTIATSIDGGTTFSTPSPEIELQDFTEGFQIVPFQAAGVTHLQLVVTNDQIIDGDPPPTVEARVGLNEVRFFTGPGTAFEITSFRRFDEVVGEATQIATELVFTSTPGMNYALDFSFDLTRWLNLEDTIPSGGASTSWIDRDQDLANLPRVYYRIREAPINN